jgi:hypothetical protein
MRRLQNAATRLIASSLTDGGIAINTRLIRHAGQRELADQAWVARTSRFCDLLLGAQLLASAVLGHHVRVRVQAHGRVVPSWAAISTTDSRPLVDQQRRERTFVHSSSAVRHSR